MRAGRLTFLLALCLLAAPASADYLKTSRTAVVRQEHESGSTEVARLPKGEAVALIGSRQRAGYYHVRLADGADGWVYRTFVRRFPGPLPGASGGETESPTPGAGALDASAFAPSDCPPEGDTQLPQLRELNRLKNRVIGPAPSAVVGTPIEDLVYPGDDRTRWSTGRAVEVVGYVHDVKVGGIETCNCRAKDAEERDTHIELVQTPEATDVDERLVVEVTPTWRRFMRTTRGVDWSTAALKGSILGKWVKVRGWLLFDTQHVQNATNTNPDGSNLWRATCWEVHPITGLDVVAAPVQ